MPPSAAKALEGRVKLEIDGEFCGAAFLWDFAPCGARARASPLHPTNFFEKKFDKKLYQRFAPNLDSH